MIELSNVGFSYGPRPVLEEIDLSIGSGELVCIVGANGAGKTTLVKLIGGLLSPATGTVRCFDLDPGSARRRDLARKLSYLPQDYRLAFPFSVAEVVLMGRYAHRSHGLLGLERSEDVDAADQAMKRCDVLELADRRFDAISGGEQRRALLAQAFCQHTALILLDEPTASLDPAHGISVFRALRSETDERAATAVVVTHDLNLSARFGDRLIVIHERRVVADGPPAEVLASAATTSAFNVAMHVGVLPDSNTPFVVPG